MTIQQNILDGIINQGTAQAALGLGPICTGTVDGLTLIQNGNTVSIAPIAAGTLFGNSGTVAAQPSAIPFGGGLAVVGGTLVPVLGGGLVLSGGSITASGTVGSVNLTSGQGLLLNGQPIININAGLNGACMIGPNAGNGTLTTGTLNTFVGNYCGQSATTATENTFLGAYTGQFVTTGALNTLIGQHAGGYMTTEGFNVAVGNDCMRNFASTNGSSTAVGKSAMYTGGSGKSVAVGFAALHGSSTTIMLGGSITTTDTLTFTFQGTNWNGGAAHAVAVPMTGISTVAQAATAVLNAFTADTTINNLMGGTIASGVVDSTNIQLGYLGLTTTTGGGGTSTTGASVTVTGSVTGAGTETITILGGNTGELNTAIGFQAMSGYYLTTGNNNVGIGSSSLYWLQTGSGNVGIGQNAMQYCTAGSSSVGIGVNALQNWTTTGSGQYNVGVGGNALKGTAGATFYASTAVGYNTGGLLSSGHGNTMVGYATGSQLTTAVNNTILGASVGSTTLATGSNNVLIGTSSSVDTPAAGTSNYLNIAGIIINSTINVPATSVTYLAGSVGVGGTSGPTWSSGAGAPSSTQPVGSIYSNASGAAGSRLYVSAGGGTWTAVASV